MTTIAIYGGNGYAGDAIRAEATRRGHEVLAISRSGKPRTDAGAAQSIVGDIHNPASVDETFKKADVVIVSIPGYEIDGRKLLQAISSLVASSAQHHTRVGVIGGSGTLYASEGGPRLLDTEGFPPSAVASSAGQALVLDALYASDRGSWFYVSPPLSFGVHLPQAAVGAYLVGGDVLISDSNGESKLSAEDLALAVLDEIETPAHENARFGVIGAY